MCNTIIPKKTLNVALTAANTLVDTKGLCCIAKAIDGNVLFKVHNDVPDSDAYTISAGEAFEFCGKGYFKTSGSAKLTCVMFEKL